MLATSPSTDGVHDSDKCFGSCSWWASSTSRQSAHARKGTCLSNSLSPATALLTQVEVRWCQQTPRSNYVYLVLKKIEESLKEILNVPVAMCEPSTNDVSGRHLEVLCVLISAMNVR